MKKSIFMCVLALTAITAFGQPDPNAPGQPGVQPGAQQGGGRQGFDITTMAENQIGQAETTMVLTDAGIFLYKAGTLAKLDYLTLAEQKKVSLFGAMPEKPAAPAQPAAGGGGNGGFMQQFQDPATQKYMAEITKRLAPPAIITTDESMFFVIGDSFFKVNQQTLAVNLQASLAKKVDPNQPAQPNGGARLGNFNVGRATQSGAPVAKIKDDVMIILKQDEILLVDTLTGKVSLRNTLPKEFLAPVAFGQGGRGQGGFGAQGGGRGQGGGGAAGGGGRGQRGGGERGQGGGGAAAGGAAVAPAGPAVIN
jgi:hypothetical protein